MALGVATRAHKGQTDKAGRPYIEHPLHLALQMKDEFSTAVALLHDVAEDADITLDELAKAGFPAQVIDALRLLTHEKSVPYFAYIESIKSNPLATQVKLADLRHNSDLSRLPDVSSKDVERAAKYQNAIKILEMA